MTAAHAQPLRCRGCAATPEQAAHHDRLLRIDVDPGQLLALFEMAVTWYELDYSRCDVLEPGGLGRLRRAAQLDPPGAGRGGVLAGPGHRRPVGGRTGRAGAHAGHR